MLQGRRKSSQVTEKQRDGVWFSEWNAKGCQTASLRAARLLGEAARPQGNPDAATDCRGSPSHPPGSYWELVHNQPCGSKMVNRHAILHSYQPGEFVSVQFICILLSPYCSLCSLYIDILIPRTNNGFTRD